MALEGTANVDDESVMVDGVAFIPVRFGAASLDKVLVLSSEGDMKAIAELPDPLSKNNCLQRALRPRLPKLRSRAVRLEAICREAGTPGCAKIVQPLQPPGSSFTVYRLPSIFRHDLHRPPLNGKLCANLVTNTFSTFTQHNMQASRP